MRTAWSRRPARRWPTCARPPGESAQLYRRQGDRRICVAAAERLTGLRDTVPVGAVLTMHAGSAAQVLLAWEDPDRIHVGLRDSTFTAATLAGRAPPGLGAERGRARAGGGLGQRAGARAVEQGGGRGVGVRAAGPDGSGPGAPAQPRRPGHGREAHRGPAPGLSETASPTHRRSQALHGSGPASAG